MPAPAAAPSSFRITIGGRDCRQPYSASIFNISAMSFGSLSANAIRALNRGAARGGFYHDTGEGSISPYHREGGDIVWEIGSGYFGCRTDDGRFDPERFARPRRLTPDRHSAILLRRASPSDEMILSRLCIRAERETGRIIGRACPRPMMQFRQTS